MKYVVKTRDNKECVIEESKINQFLYNNYIGRILLKIIILPFVSKIMGLYQDSQISKYSISNFIKRNNINMEDYQKEDYKTFNEFFTRKIKDNKREINSDNNTLISPCDAKVLAVKIEENSTFNIKNSTYHINDLTGIDMFNKYQNGYALIFRLTVEDYHRYSYIDSGYQEENHKIKGLLHTVRPIAVYNEKVFTRNERNWTILHTDNFGDVVYIEVGALLVGKIINHNEHNKFTKGEEKGYFKFGASTIILLVNNIKIDTDILKNSKDNIETIVKLGEKIGQRL